LAIGSYFLDRPILRGALLRLETKLDSIAYACRPYRKFIHHNRKSEFAGMTLEILSYESTPLGILMLRRRDLLSRPDVSVTEVTLNHEFLMSSYLTESETALTRIGLEWVLNGREDPGDLSVLVGGLGLGYTAAEALNCEQVSQLEIVEYLPEVIGWLEQGLIPLAEQLNTDRRSTVNQGDIYARLGQLPTQTYDLIAIDVDHSPADVLGTQSHGFYSESGLTSAKNHLRRHGVLGVWSYAEDTPLLTNMKSVFEKVVVEKISIWNDLIDEQQTDWLFFGQ
jgi:hypothetical protein